jgi:hypothetical protein
MLCDAQMGGEEFFARSAAEQSTTLYLQQTLLQPGPSGMQLPPGIA